MKSKLPRGISKYNVYLPKSISNIIITTIDEKFTLDEFQDINIWESKIQANPTIYTPSGITEYEDTTDELILTSSGLSKKYKALRPVASANFSLESNLCDHETLISKANKNIYRMFFVLSDNTFLGFEKNGYKMGFKCEITAKSIPIGTVDTPQKSYEIVVNFRDQNEFDNMFNSCPDFNYENICELMPIGVTVKHVSKYFLYNDFSVLRAYIPCSVMLTGEINETSLEIISAYLSSGEDLVITDLDYNEDTKFLELVAEDALGDVLQEGDMFTIRIKTNEYRSDEFNVLVVDATFEGSYSLDYSESYNIGFENIITT